jgi:putative transposase
LGLSQCGKYNELNPVRARIVSNPEEYGFSSYRHYALGQKDPLISPSPWYLSLSPDRDERMQLYRNFVVKCEFISGKILRQQRYIGEDDFLRAMEEKFGIPAFIKPRGRPPENK